MAYPTAYTLGESGFPHVAATVPGNFEIDLERAGALDDVFFGMNPLDAQKREHWHLFYTRTFSVGETGEYTLTFEGIDTFADIF